jgi:hypothetical protein
MVLEASICSIGKLRGRGKEIKLTGLNISTACTVRALSLNSRSTQTAPAKCVGTAHKLVTAYQLAAFFWPY